MKTGNTRTRRADAAASDAVAYLFNEELGVVIQVPANGYERVAKLLAAQRLPHHAVARIAKHDDFVVRRGGAELYRAQRVELRRRAVRVEFHRSRPAAGEQQDSRQG